MREEARKRQELEELKQRNDMMRKTIKSNVKLRQQSLHTIKRNDFVEVKELTIKAKQELAEIEKSNIAKKMQQKFKIVLDRELAKSKFRMERTMKKSEIQMEHKSRIANE